MSEVLIWLAVAAVIVLGPFILIWSAPDNPAGGQRHAATLLAFHIWFGGGALFVTALIFRALWALFG